LTSLRASHPIDFAVITDFIPPEWLWGTALVALIAAESLQFSLESRNRDFQGADAWPFLAFLSLMGRAEG
jgi:hypothetical protein